MGELARPIHRSLRRGTAKLVIDGSAEIAVEYQAGDDAVFIALTKAGSCTTFKTDIDAAMAPTSPGGSPAGCRPTPRPCVRNHVGEAYGEGRQRERGILRPSSAGAVPPLIESDPKAPRFLLTMSGAGYKFAANSQAVERNRELTADVALEPKAFSGKERCGRPRGAEALRVNPSPRRSLRSGARVSRRPASPEIAVLLN